MHIELLLKHQTHYKEYYIHSKDRFHWNIFHHRKKLKFQVHCLTSISIIIEDIAFKDLSFMCRVIILTEIKQVKDLNYYG